jgi:hypothetical protein
VSADAKCGLGGTPASIAGAANDEPCATCDVCDVSGGARVEIVPCKLELHDFSPPMLLARLGPDSTPNPGSNYPPGGT